MYSVVAGYAANDASCSEYMREERVSCNRADIDNDHNIRAINFFILGAILVSISIRLSTKFHRFTKWGVDDYLIIPAAVSGTHSPTQHSGLLTSLSKYSDSRSDTNNNHDS